MSCGSFLAKLDVFHHCYEPKTADLSKRGLTGHIFGTDIPAYIIFHAMLGYTLLGVGLATLILRLPLKTIRRGRWLHPFLGYAWVFGTVWMPVTAIWCVYVWTGWDIIAFFIFSMFATIQLGWICIKTYRSMQQRSEREPTTETRTKEPRKLTFWKVCHAVLMSYSFIMLLGAGVSFPTRSFQSFAKEYAAYDQIRGQLNH